MAAFDLDALNAVRNSIGRIHCDESILLFDELLSRSEDCEDLTEDFRLKVREFVRSYLAQVADLRAALVGADADIRQATFVSLTLRALRMEPKEAVRIPGITTPASAPAPGTLGFVWATHSLSKTDLFFLGVMVNAFRFEYDWMPIRKFHVDNGSRDRVWNTGKRVPLACKIVRKVYDKLDIPAEFRI